MKVRRLQIRGVFSTTIGHNNVTVTDPRYLDSSRTACSGAAASSFRLFKGGGGK
jgi:hypothetical protein